MSILLMISQSIEMVLFRIAADNPEIIFDKAELGIREDSAAAVGCCGTTELQQY